MRRVILTTVFSGYNYGSSLQALAGKTVLKQVGLECEIVSMKSLVKGRDIRFGKLFTILCRSFLGTGKKGANSIATYQSGYSKKMIGDSTARFQKFTEDFLQPNYLSWHGLKKAAIDCVACFAGSDQIWNSSTLYVDPLYYLRFAPAEKRVAFAPSFGRDFIAEYNKTKMKRWISEFALLSVREDSGVGLIKSLTGKDAVQLIDPTMMVDCITWKETLGIKDKEGNYILAYFLDKPSEKARLVIKEIKDALKCEVIAIPYQFENMGYCDRAIPTGPIEFLDLVNNAKCVITDSFHGTAFSINLQTPFYVFGRDYGSAHSQNSRVESILRKMKMEDRFEPLTSVESLDKIDFGHSERVLKEERDKAITYIKVSIEKVNSR
jgi:hypothetical protein